MLEATHRFSEAALSAKSLDELYAAIHKIIAELIPAQNLYIAIFYPELDRFTYPYWVDQKDPRPLSYTLGGRGLTAYVVCTGQPLLATTADIEHLIKAEKLELLGTMPQQWLGVPLRTRDKTIGVLVVQSYEDAVRSYTDSDKELLSFVSTQVAMAIERVRAEEGLRENEERYRGLFENANDIVYTCDLAGNITSFNHAGERVLGYTREEALGMRWDQFLAAGEGELVSPLTWKDGARREELVMLAKDGHKVHIENSAWVTYRGGEPVGVQGIARDITERVKLGGQLRQSQKMEAIGRLAGGIAHDFNNLLIVINGYTKLALVSLEPDSPVYRDLEKIQQAGEQAANLTRQLMAFSRRQVVELRTLDLNQELESMRDMFQRLLGEDILLRMKLAPGLGYIKADAGQMGQVVINLAVNARDAMPDGGVLTVETANVELDEGLVPQQAAAPAGQYLALVVRDTGIGMSAEVKERLFEPFFTTKEKGKGTGLGLSTVHSIVNQMGGFIEVESQPGEGTAFTIYLRCSEEGGTTDEPGSDEVALQGGVETVLVVEDDSSVRELVTETLQELGYVVLQAENGNTALEMCRTRVQPIDLVLTDVIMPEMSGRELVEKLRECRQDFRVLYMSGYMDEIVSGRGGLGPGAHLIRKPFSMEQLAAQVRQALEEGRGQTAEEA